VKGSVSREAAEAALHIIRDIHELGIRELNGDTACAGPDTTHTGQHYAPPCTQACGLAITSVASTTAPAPPSIRTFLNSLVDLRAGLLAALAELRLMERLAVCYQRGATAGVPHEDLLPLLECLVAMACMSTSIDQPASRCVAQTGGLGMSAAIGPLTANARWVWAGRWRL
jgi:hypothetical protein